MNKCKLAPLNNKHVLQGAINDVQFVIDYDIIYSAVHIICTALAALPQNVDMKHSSFHGDTNNDIIVTSNETERGRKRRERFSSEIGFAQIATGAMNGVAKSPCEAFHSSDSAVASFARLTFRWK